MKNFRYPTKVLKLNHILILIFALFVIDQAYCQVQNDEPLVAISLTKVKVLYLGIDNPVKIAASGYASSELVASVEKNGMLEGADGEYIIRPDRPGKLTVVVKAGGKVLDRVVYQVKLVPDLNAAINTGSIDIPNYKQGGTISIEDLLKNNRLEAVIPNFSFDLPMEISSFSLVKETNGEEESIPSRSNQLTDEQKELISELSSGDNVYFKNIHVNVPGDKNMPLTDLEFIIKEY